MTWYSEPRRVPEHLDTADLHLEILGPKHVDMDLEALLSSRERLMKWSGGSWPHEGFTREENMADMIMHHGQYLERYAFTYTVLNTTLDRAEGCIYIYPLAGSQTVDTDAMAAAMPEATARITFWVRDDALERDLDRQLVEGLVTWLRSAWDFDAVTFQVRPDNHRDIELLENAGLTNLGLLENRKQPGGVLLYQLQLTETD